MTTTLSKSEAPVESSSENITFSLPEILPGNAAFVMNTRTGTLLLVSIQDGLPRLHAEVYFTGNEIPMLQELFSNYPDYAPYPNLYAAFYQGSQYTEKDIERTCRFLDKALSGGTWAKETRQVRRGVSRVRIELSSLELRVRSVLETGYLLQGYRERGEYVIKDVPGIVHFPLPGLLGESHVLAVSPHGFISHLAVSMGDVQVLGIERFAPGELALILPLLTDYPDYCPSEVLLAHLNTTIITDTDVTRARRVLRKALMEGRWSGEMAPVRNLLSRVRPKMHSFGIEMKSIVETGYMLMAAHKPQKAGESEIARN